MAKHKLSNSGTDSGRKVERSVRSRLTGEKVRGIVLYGMGPALGLLSGPVLAHAMGAEGRGQFASIMQPITMAAAIASIGIPSAIAYFIAKGYNPRDCFRVSLAIGIFPTLAVSAVMIFYARVVSDKQNIPFSFLLLCWSAIILSAIVQIRRGAWQGLGRWRLLDFERGAGAFLRFAFVIGVALIGARAAEYFAGAALISFVLAALILFVPIPASTAPKASWISVGKYSTLASVGTISTIASSRLDQLLMPAASSATELGYYAVAVTVAEIPLVLATLAARNSLQKAAKGVGNQAIFRDCALFFGVCVAAVIAIIVFAAAVTPIAFGDEFRASVLPMQILSISSILTWVSIVTSSILSGRGYPGIGSCISLVSLGATALSFTLFWDSISSTSAAVISLSSSGLAAVVGIVLVRRVQNPRPDLNPSLSIIRNTEVSKLKAGE